MRHNHCSGIWCSLEITRLAAIILQKIVKYVMQSQKSKGRRVYYSAFCIEEKTNIKISLYVLRAIANFSINQTGNFKNTKALQYARLREALHWKAALVTPLLLFLFWYFTFVFIAWSILVSAALQYSAKYGRFLYRCG